MRTPRLAALIWVLLLLGQLAGAGEAAAAGPAATPAELFRRGEFEKVIAALDQPNSAEDRALKALAQAGVGQGEAALQTLDLAGKLGEATPIQAARGEVLADQGRWAEAIKSLTAACREMREPAEPWQMRARLRLAELYQALGGLTLQQDVCEWFFDYHDQQIDKYENLDAPTAFYIGAGAVLGGDFKSGLKLVALAEKKAPDWVEPFVTAGNIFAEKYQYEDAAGEYAAALKINPRAAGALVGQARLALSRSDLAAGEKLARQALSIQPNCPEASLLLAQIELVDERPETAEKAAEAIFKVRPEWPEALTFLAVLSRLEGQDDNYGKLRERLMGLLAALPLADDEARAASGKLVDSRLLAAVGESLSDNHRIEEALPLLRQAAELDPENAAAQTQLGICLMRHGLDGEAEKPLRAAFELDPFNVWVYNLIKLAERDKQYEKFASGRLLIKLPKADAEIFAPYVREWAETQLVHDEQIYGFKVAQPVRVTWLKSHDDFSARVTGLPHLDASGASFGPFVALVSPRAMLAGPSPDNWCSVLRHELAHVVTLAATNYRIPRWLGEGLSVHAEGWITPDWDGPFKTMMVKGPLPKIEDWNRDFNRPSAFYRIPAAYMAAGLFVGWFADEFGADKLPALAKAYQAGRPEAEIFPALCGRNLEQMNQWLTAKLTAYAPSVQAPVLENPESAKEWVERLKKDAADHEAALGLIRICGLTRPAKLPPPLKAVGEGQAATAEAKSLQGEYWLMIGQAALGRRRLPAAQEALGKALKLDDRLAVAEFYLGQLAAHNGQKAEAAKRYARAIELYPRYAAGGAGENPYRELAELRQEAGDRAGEREILEKYVAVRRSDPEAYRLLGQVCRELNDLPAALTAYNDLLKIDPYRRAVHEALADLYTAQKQAERAAAEKKIAAACAEEKPAPGGPAATGTVAPTPAAVPAPATVDPAADLEKLLAELYG